MPPIETAGLVVAALLGVVALARYVWRAFKFFDRLNALVEGELRHNGGSSIKDQVKETSEGMARIEERLAFLAIRDESHERELGGLQARVNALEETR